MSARSMPSTSSAAPVSTAPSTSSPSVNSQPPSQGENQPNPYAYPSHPQSHEMNPMMMYQSPHHPHPNSYPQPSPLNPVNFNHQIPTSASNPSSSTSLKRKATSDDFSGEGAPKLAKLDSRAGGAADVENCPMRKLEMMANSQNFRTGNTINEVVESNNKK